MVKKSLLLLLLSLISAPWVYAAPYTNHGNNTVTDQGSGLMWQQSDDSVARSWQGSLDYCNGLTLAGHNDWRLPNIKELESIVDATRSNPSVDPVFTGTSASYNWSSTSDAYGPEGAWIVYFDYGYVHHYNKTSNYYVRCVR